MAETGNFVFRAVSDLRDTETKQTNGVKERIDGHSQYPEPVSFR